MKQLLCVLFCLTLLGCAEQNPAQVVSAVPSTYNPLPGLKAEQSRAVQKIQLSRAKPAWVWPTNRNVLRKLSGTGPTKKGIDILGIEGTPILAAADGEVVYSGNSLKGYGNLIIIKHKKNYITAYAHNKKNMVKEGDKVVLGQCIAEMGKSGTDKVKLHFEVRQDGKPIDPRAILPR